MTWQVFSRPEVEKDVIEIAGWYNSRSEGLGERFIKEFLAVLDELAKALCCPAVDILARTFAGVTPEAFRSELFTK